MVHAFPSYTAYLLIYTVLLNFVFLLRPSPYGKFSIDSNKGAFSVSVSNEAFKQAMHIGFFLFWLGWFDGDMKLHQTLPTSARGWLLLVWLNIYFLWRVLLCPMASYYKVDLEVIGQKRVPLWLVIVYLLFYLPAGMYLREMVAESNRVLQFYEYVLILFGMVALALNGYADVQMSRNRGRGKEYKYIGYYLCEKQIFESLEASFVLYDYMVLPPNYAFEVIHWFIFMFLAWSWHGVWWFAFMFVFLLVRGFHQKSWYRMESETDSCKNITETKQFGRYTDQGEITY